MGGRWPELSQVARSPRWRTLVWLSGQLPELNALLVALHDMVDDRNRQPSRADAWYAAGDVLIADRQEAGQPSWVAQDGGQVVRRVAMDWRSVVGAASTPMDVESVRGLGELARGRTARRRRSTCPAASPYRWFGLAAACCLCRAGKGGACAVEGSVKSAGARQLNARHADAGR